jgi:anti-sigma factor RsiW
VIAEELSCQELVELVTEYFEGALSPEDARLFEQHAATCEGCGRYLDQMRRAIELAGRLTPESIDPEAEAALLSAFRDWKSRSGATD